MITAHCFLVRVLKSREDTGTVTDHSTVQNCEEIIDFSVRVLNGLFPLTYIDERLVRGFPFKNTFLVNWERVSHYSTS